MSEEEFYKKLRYNFFGSKDCKDFKELVKAYNDKSKKLELYRSIVNELEKDIDLELCKTRANDEYNKGLYNAFLYVKYKLQELKGEDKE